MAERDGRNTDLGLAWSGPAVHVIPMKISSSRNLRQLFLLPCGYEKLETPI
jgi:hypothetical protein